MIPLLRLSILSPTPPPQSSRVASEDSRAPSAGLSVSPSPMAVGSRFGLRLELLVEHSGEEERVSHIQTLQHEKETPQEQDPLKAYLLKRKRGIRRLFGERLGHGASGEVFELVHVRACFPKKGVGEVIYQPIPKSDNQTGEVIKCFFDNNHAKLGGEHLNRGHLLALSIPPHRNLVTPTRVYVKGADGTVRAVTREHLETLSVKDQLIAEVAPHFKGQSLADYPRAKEEIGRIALQIINGLKHLHKHGVIHRDVKPENILVGKKGVVKLIDWGIAIHENEIPKTPIGTMKHKAPETFHHDRVHTLQADAFSLGSTLYEIYFGKQRPRVEWEPEAIFYNPEEDRNLNRNDPIVRLIKGLLHPNPLERMTLAEAEVRLRGMLR